MNNAKENREVSVRDLFFSVLYQWRKLLVAAVALALILGGWKLCRGLNEATNEETAARYEQQYQADLAQYNQQVADLEAGIADIQEDIANQQEYLQNSVLMDVDYHNVHEATMSFYISTDYQIMPEMTYQNPDPTRIILATYQAALTDSQMMAELAREMGIQTKYLRELVTVDKEMDHFLTVSVRHATRSGAVQMRNLITQQVRQLHKQISDSIGEHQVEPVINSVSSDIDIGIAERQEKERSRLTEYQEKYASMVEELNGLKEPVKVEISAKNAIKTGVKFFVVGGIAGLILAVLVSCVVFLLSDRVYSGRELKARFGIKVLGGIPGSRKNGKVDTWLMKKEDRTLCAAEEAYSLAAANLKNYGQGVQTVLVTGDAGSELTQAVCDGLQKHLQGVRLVCCGSLLEQADAAQTMMQCDAVVLAEQCGTSRYAHVAQQIERVLDCGRKLLGCVVAER